MTSTKGRPRGAMVGSMQTYREISQITGIPVSTVARDCSRVRDILALEIVFSVLPRRVQREWLRNKLAAA